MQNLKSASKWLGQIPKVWKKSWKYAMFDHYVNQIYLEESNILSFQMFISTICNRLKPRRVGGNTYFMVIYITKVLLFWFFHLIFNFFVQDGDPKKISRSAVTERKISYFFKCHVMFQETKFWLRNHRGRCIYNHSSESCCFYTPKRAKK